MTMGWMETIRFIGLDLQFATVIAVAGLDVSARALKSAWGRIPAWRTIARFRSRQGKEVAGVSRNSPAETWS